MSGVYVFLKNLCTPNLFEEKCFPMVMDVYAERNKFLKQNCLLKRSKNDILIMYFAKDIHFNDYLPNFATKGIKEGI